MSNIYDPPETVFVLSYVWSSGASSSGTQEVFLSQRELELRLESLLEDEKLKRDTRVLVRQLVDGKWLDLNLQWPTRMRVLAANEVDG